MIAPMRPTAPALVLLPAFALLPVLIVVLNGSHGGGAEILGSFVVGAVSPAMDPALLKALLIGLQVTIATALTGWSCSLVLGVLLGCLSSERLWLTWSLPVCLDPFCPDPAFQSPYQS